MKKATKRIAYDPVLLTYLDILGFKDRIERSKSKATEVRKTHALLRRLQEQYSQARRFVAGEDNKPHYITQFRSFSDLMIRVTETRQDGDNLAGYLNSELVVLSNTQCDCVALWGDLLRGAIFSGDLYLDDDVTFGPSLGEAYLLESGTAVFPRIVIDVDLLKRAWKTGRVWEGDYIKRGDDGVYFVDYLFGSYLDRYSWPDELSKKPDEILAEHKAVVEKKLKEVEKEKDYRKRQKIIWLAQYHNTTLKKLVDRFKGVLPDRHFDVMEIPEELFRF
jgi:hypothetical protein